MKRHLYFLALFLLFASHKDFAQCPPSGFPMPSGSGDCANAPVFCDGLDGYCDTLAYTPAGPTQCCPPGCDWLFFGNEQYFAFVAGTTSISIQITSSDCIEANGVDGVAASITEGCSGPVMVFNCFEFNSPGTYTLTSDNYVVGETYYMVLMGYGGSSCDFSIAVTSGLTYYDVPPNPGAITGPVSACEGSIASYTVAGAGGSTPGWEITPPDMGSFVGGNGGGTVSVQWEMAGTAQLCIADNPACPTNPVPACLTVEVGPFGLALDVEPANCGLSNGSIDLTVSDGTPPFTYAWSNGPTTEDIANVGIGTYTVTVTGGGGCTSTASATVPSASPPISVPGTANPNTACSPPNGGVDITPSGGAPPYTFAWSNGTDMEDLLGVSNGTYTVTVTAGAGCTATATFNVANQLAVPLLAATPTASNCGLANGSVNLTPSGGAAPYTFAWSNGPTTEDISGLTAGSYSVTVTGANGCTATASATVADDPISISITGTTTPAPNGTVDITASPTNGYTYAWSNGASTQDIAGLSAGTYTVTVTLGTGCTATASFLVDSFNPPPIDITGVVFDDTCGVGHGAVDITVNGGTPPYSYSWNNGATTQDIANLTSNWYFVTVTDALGETSTANFLVQDFTPNFPIIFGDLYSSELLDNTACSGPPNGGWDFTNLTGLPFAWSWSNGAMTEDNLGIAAGSYFATITVGTCLTYFSGNSFDNFDVPLLAAIPTPATCGLSNGSIDLTVTDGEPPYTFAWNTGATTEDLVGIPAGYYEVTVTGANGCTDSDSWVIPDNMPFTATGTATPASACPGPNGAIDLTPAPAGSYTFSWSNGASTEDLTNIAAGSYAVTVTDANGCTATASFVVDDTAAPPSLTATPTPASCGLSNGGVNLTPSGGTAPYTYAWSNGAATEDLSNVPGSSYTVTVTGANGCTATASATVPDNPISISITGSTLPNTYCIGSNGSVSTTVTPPSPPVGSYAYSWGNPTGTYSATTPNIANLPGGSYALTVSVGTCSATASFTVANEPATPSLGTSTQPAACGQPSGGVDLTVVGGQSPFGYEWSNGAVDEDLSGVPAGSYTVTVTGLLDGCTASASAFVPDNGGGTDTTAVFGTSCDANDVGVFGQVLTGSSGCDSVVITTITFSAADTTAIYDTSCDINDVGVFEQTLTNGNGCDSLIITTITYSAADTTAIYGTSCDINAVGVFEQTLTNGNGCDSLIVTTITYSAADTTAIYGTSCDINAVGVFEQTLTNGNGCDSLIITTIAYAAADTTAIYGTSCDINDVGVFEQTLTNGNGCDSLIITTIAYAAADTTAIYGTSCDINAVGVFEQTLTNGNGCDSLIITTITYATADTTNIFGTSCNINEVGIFEQTLTNTNGCDSLIITTITYSASDTTAVYGTSCDINAVGVFEQILTNDSGCDSLIITTVTLLASDTTALFGTSCNPASVGTFTQNLTNQGGCDSTVVLTVAYSLSDTTLLSSTTCDPAQAGTFVQDLTTIEGCDSVVIATVSLLPGSTTFLASTTCDPTAAGVFTQNLMTWQGCDSTVTTTVALLPSASTSLTATTCDALQAGIFIENLTTWQGCDSTVTTTVALHPGSTTFLTGTTCDPTAAGVFIQNLTNQNGCDSTVTTTVSLLPGSETFLTGMTCNPTAAGVFIQNLTNQFGCDSTVTTTVALLPGSMTFLTGTTCDATAAGVFIQNLTTWQGCDSTVVMTVTLTPPPTLAVSASDYSGFGITCAGALDGWAQASATGLPPLGFAWQDGTAQPLLDGLSAGSYAVTVTDGNGCTSMGMVSLTGPEPLANSLSVNALGCFDDSSGAVTVSASGGVPPYLYSLDAGPLQSSGTFGGLSAGAYEITVQDANGCTATDLVAINAPVPLSVNLGDDVFLELGDGTILATLTNVPLDSLTQIDWSGTGSLECPGCPTQQVFPLVTTAYSVTVVDGQGCSASDGVTVYVDRRKSVYVPNAFSPNGDGINDLLVIFAKQEQVKAVKSFLVFDRWGESVFRYSNFGPNDPAFGWDGTHRGQLLDAAVFVWFAEVEFVDGSTELFMGDVGLVR